MYTSDHEESMKDRIYIHMGWFNRRNHCQNNKTKKLFVTVFNKCSSSGKWPRTEREPHLPPHTQHTHT